MKKWFVRWLRKHGWVYVGTPGPVKGMTDSEMLSAFAVPEHAPWFKTVRYLLDHAITSANDVGQNPSVAIDHGLLAYYAGGAAHLDAIKERIEALRRRALPEDR